MADLLYVQGVGTHFVVVLNDSVEDSCQGRGEVVDVHWTLLDGAAGLEHWKTRRAGG